MLARREYEMTEAQQAALFEACRPVPAMFLSGGVPMFDQQENVNRAWAAIGRELGFDGMTVQPVEGKGQRFFTAVPIEGERLEPAAAAAAKGPASVDEYLERFKANERLSGRFLETTMHMPCPFCAAPDWLVYKILEVDTAIRKGGTCSECGRSARALVDRSSGGVAFAFFQTGGDEPPTWMPDPMPRMGDPRQGELEEPGA